MRILHTSDWHLGRTFHGKLLETAHAAFFDHLVEVVSSEKIDALLVCGDIYDRGVPPHESVALLDDALRRLTEHTRVVITPGNHDSARRLGFASDLFTEGLVIRARSDQVGVGLELPDAEANRGALLYPLPYLDPDGARESLVPLLAQRLNEHTTPSERVSQRSPQRSETGQAHPDSHIPQFESQARACDEETPRQGRPLLPRSHEAVVGAALRLIAADLAARRRGTHHRIPALVMAHAFVTGAQASESERDIRVGGLDGVPAALFSSLGGAACAPECGGLDYVALGHLHRPQRIGTAAVPGPELVYSGSPLALSFDEAPQAKSTVLIDLDPSGIRGWERIDVPVHHPITTLRGTFEELMSLDIDKNSWVRIILTSQRHIDTLLRLKDAFPNLLVFSQELPSPQVRAATVVHRTSDPLRIASDFLSDVGGRDSNAEEEAILRLAYESVLATHRSM